MEEELLKALQAADQALVTLKIYDLGEKEQEDVINLARQAIAPVLRKARGLPVS
jgi:hypothetical protein